MEKKGCEKEKKKKSEMRDPAADTAQIQLSHIASQETAADANSRCAVKGWEPPSVQMCTVT